MPSDIKENIDNNLESSTKLIEKLIALENKLPPILDDYNNAYVLHKNNPNDQQYQQSYNMTLSNLNQVNSELFSLSAIVNGNTENLIQLLDVLNVKIIQAQKTNTKLKSQLALTESNVYATTEMIIDYKQMYMASYLKNWALFLSIVLAGVAIKIVFTKKIGVISK